MTIEMLYSLLSSKGMTADIEIQPSKAHEYIRVSIRKDFRRISVRITAEEFRQAFEGAGVIQKKIIAGIAALE